MREMKHSKKLAFAVLAAIAAVGATVAPVNAESGVYGDNNTVCLLYTSIYLKVSCTT